SRKGHHCRADRERRASDQALRRPLWRWRQAASVGKARRRTRLGLVSRRATDFAGGWDRPESGLDCECRRSQSAWDDAGLPVVSRVVARRTPDRLLRPGRRDVRRQCRYRERAPSRPEGPDLGLVRPARVVAAAAGQVTACQPRKMNQARSKPCARKSSTSSGGAGVSIESAISALPPMFVLDTAMLAMLTPASPKVVPTRPITPGLSSYRKKAIKGASSISIW